MCLLCDDEKAYAAYMNYLDAMERQGKAADPDQDQPDADRHAGAEQHQEGHDPDQAGEFGRDHGCFGHAARANSKAMNSAKTTHSTRSQRSGRWSSSVCS